MQLAFRSIEMSCSAVASGTSVFVSIGSSSWIQFVVFSVLSELAALCSFRETSTIWPLHPQRFYFSCARCLLGAPGAQLSPGHSSGVNSGSAGAFP